jgi:peptidyl-prolyl cis-trans isomerase D
VSEAEVDRYVKLRDQSRDFRYYFVVMPADATPVSDGDLEHYYNAHRDDYMSPEQVALEYLELNAADLEVPAEVDDTTLKARYEEQKARYSVNEQRLASHILVKVDKGADAEAHKQAQAKAQALVEQARAGKNFADLAKSSSDDLGSKNQGGDLGWLEHGLTEPAFDAALFKLNAGEISDPVLTDQGFHVIQLREVKAGSVKPFESVRADLMKEYVESERERRYSEISGRLIDLVYQNPGSLEPAAEALKLKPQRTPLFGREGGPGVAANPNVLKKAFSDSVLVDGNASDPIDIGTNHVVVIRVAEHKPKAARPLAEVKDAVLARFRAEKIADAAKAKAEELRKQIAGGASFDQLQKDANATASTAKGVGRRAKNQDPTLVQEAFKLPRPAQGKSSLAVVDLPLNRFAVVEVTEASDGDPSKLDEAARKSVREELVRNIGASEVRGLLDVLRARTPTKVVEDRL